MYLIDFNFECNKNDFLYNNNGLYCYSLTNKIYRLQEYVRKYNKILLIVYFGHIN